MALVPRDMRSHAAALPTDEELAPLALEARWHSLAVAVVLPMILASWTVAAILAFGLFEMGLATAHRRHLLRRLPQPAAVRVEARRIF